MNIHSKNIYEQNEEGLQHSSFVSSSEKNHHKKKSHHKIKTRLGRRLRTYFFTGILVTAPAFITFYLAWMFITFVDLKVKKFIPPEYNPDAYLPFGIPGLGLIILIILLTLIGAFAAGFFGRFLVRIGEWMLGKMPIIRGVYGALKQIFETVFGEKSSAFREVVLFEYPRKGIWAMGFITSETKGEVQSVTKEKMVNIFVPTTPNPTSGFLLFLPRKDLKVLKMSVEEGLKMIISSGIIAPPEKDKKQSSSKKKSK